MSFRPSKPAFCAKQGEINRVAIISQFEQVDPNPDQLTLLKRKVKQFDDLEVSNNAAWLSKLAAISRPEYRKMFQGGNNDRLRFRYLVYGWDDETLALVLADLTTAFAT